MISTVKVDTFNVSVKLNNFNKKKKKKHRKKTPTHLSQLIARCSLLMSKIFFQHHWVMDQGACDRQPQKEVKRKLKRVVLCSVFWAKMSKQSLRTKCLRFSSLFLGLGINVASWFHYFPFFLSISFFCPKVLHCSGEPSLLFNWFTVKVQLLWGGKSVSELITQHACGYMTCSTAFCLLVGFDFSYHLVCLDSE